MFNHPQPPAPAPAPAPASAEEVVPFAPVAAVPSPAAVSVAPRSKGNGLLQKIDHAYTDEIHKDVPRFTKALEALLTKSNFRGQTLLSNLGTFQSNLIKLRGELDKALNDTTKPADADRREYLRSYMTKRCVKFIDDVVRQYYGFYRFHTDFVTRTFREPLRLLKQYTRTERSDQAGKAVEALQALQDQVTGITDEYMKQFNGVFTDKDILSLLEGEQIDTIYARRDKANDQIDGLGAKVVNMYSRDWNGLLQMLSDSQFSLLYMLKGVRLGLLSLAIYLAGTIFTNQYVDAVFTKKLDPPLLLYLVLLVIGLDVALNVMLWVVLWLVQRIVFDYNKQSLLDGTFWSRCLADYAVFTAVFLVITIIISEIIRRKDVFKYKQDGVPTITAFKYILFAIGGFLLIVPYFLVV